MFCDAGYQQFLASTGAKLEDEAEKYLQLNNAALEGKPADLVVTTHVCRGNYHSTWGQLRRVCAYCTHSVCQGACGRLLSGV